MMKIINLYAYCNNLSDLFAFEVYSVYICRIFLLIGISNSIPQKEKERRSEAWYSFIKRKSMKFY